MAGLLRGDNPYARSYVRRVEGIGDIDVEGCSKLFFNDRAYRVWRVSNLSCVDISQS